MRERSFSARLTPPNSSWLGRPTIFSTAAPTIPGISRALPEDQAAVRQRRSHPDVRPVGWAATAADQSACLRTSVEFVDLSLLPAAFRLLAPNRNRSAHDRSAP